ncbi:MAG TPA: fused MFS/spermidine synthase [Verrucomicrobiae bacterium]|nr:fused MFS/spermidine synthase [Verrucomicrobiae bacterium]
MLIVYGITIFTGAALLFIVQPMVGRMVLPLLGGSPAVWNTTMVFYQAVLLAGYAYAHFTTRWLGIRRQAMLHAVMLLLPFLVMPVVIPHDWTPPPTHNPIPWLLAVLAMTVGVPFFVVSATSPLLQRWFSASGHRAAADPYFLYAASNCGSLLALVVYPAFIEPHLRLGEQSLWWLVGYDLLAGLTAVCGLWITRRLRLSAAAESSAEPAALEISGEPLTAGRRWRWVILAFVPCSLMLSVTTYITSEVAPIPLLWVIPLGVYLLAFIFAFARRRLVPHRWMARMLPVAAAVVVATLVARVVHPIGGLIALHLACLFIVSMACLGELADDRPSTAHLTEFYLWLSVGGVLGGVFNAMVAPLIFSTVAEYPLTLVLACLLMPNWASATTAARRQRALDFAVPLLIGLFAANLLQVLRGGTTWPVPVLMAVMYGVPVALCLLFVRRSLRFALALAGVLMACALVPGYADHTLLVERNFFGIHRISLDPRGQYHWLEHGNTIHGIQHVDLRQRDEPLSYFTKRGPFGQAFATLDDSLKRRVGVIGLGAGSLAAYARRGEHWTFYEIDPAVEEIAEDPRYFTFLHDCPADVDVVMGDARLSLQQARDGQYGVLVLDAYTSDTIPLHLITQEAMALYLRKLAPDGVLIFHISNRHLRLERVLGVLAQNVGLACLIQNETGGGEDELLATGKISSKWMIMARQPDTLLRLGRDARWQSPPPHLQARLWTDDYASVFSVFIWR